MMGHGLRQREENRRMRGIFLWFFVALVTGTALVYLRLWTIDSAFSRDERELLRSQFDRAKIEAMDESAEWRMRFDAQLDATNQIQLRLSQVKDDLARANEKLENLLKEKLELQSEVERLKRRNSNCSISST